MRNSKKLAFDLLRENSQRAYFSAIKSFNSFIDEDPNDGEAYLGKAIAMGNLLNVYGWTSEFKEEEVIKAFDKSIELDPKNALTWFQKAEFFIESEAGTEQAISYYNKCLELDPTFEAAKSALKEVESKK